MWLFLIIFPETSFLYCLPTDMLLLFQTFHIFFSRCFWCICGCFVLCCVVLFWLSAFCPKGLAVIVFSDCLPILQNAVLKTFWLQSTIGIRFYVVNQNIHMYACAHTPLYTSKGFFETVYSFLRAATWNYGKLVT